MHGYLASNSCVCVLFEGTDTEYINIRYLARSLQMKAQLFSINSEPDLSMVEWVPLKCLQHLHVILWIATITNFEGIQIVLSELCTILINS